MDLLQDVSLELTFISAFVVGLLSMRPKRPNPFWPLNI